MSDDAGRRTSGVHAREYVSEYVVTFDDEPIIVKAGNMDEAMVSARARTKVRRAGIITGIALTKAEVEIVVKWSAFAIARDGYSMPEAEKALQKKLLEMI